MKKYASSALRFLSVVSAFFISGIVIILIIFAVKYAFDLNINIERSIITKILIISILYAITSPVTFSEKHFVSLSVIVRLLIQTALNYPILIACGALFGWIRSLDGFCRITTVYFFAGIVVAAFICLYYSRKSKLYSDKLHEYKKKAFIDKINEMKK